MDTDNNVISQREGGWEVGRGGGKEEEMGTFVIV